MEEEEGAPSEARTRHTGVCEIYKKLGFSKGKI